MRVAMYYRNSDVRLEEMPVPEIGPGELYAVYDVGRWGRPGRATYGCVVRVQV